MPSARNTDPVTSHLAAASVSGISELQAHLLAIFHSMGDCTDEELANFHAQMVQMHGWPPASPSGLRTRRAELVAAGRLWDVGRSTTASGRACTVYGIQAPPSAAPNG
jgi:hypothetical protein